MTEATTQAGRPGRPPTWDEAAISRLRELWEAGESAGAIAAALTPHLGRTVSRNMVLGKVHRLGLTRPEAPALDPEPVPESKSRTKTGTKPVAAPDPAPAPAEEPVMTLPFAKPERPPAPAQVLPATGLPGFDLLDVPMFGCRWPVHDRPFRCCGAPFDAANTFWFCPDHMAIAIDPRSRLQARRDSEKAAQTRAARGRAA